METKVEKEYPKNHEAEQQVLCCILIDNNVAMDSLPQLNESHFCTPKNKIIFNVMKELHSKGEIIDMVTINDVLKKTQAGNDYYPYLYETKNILPSAANYRRYLKILKRDEILRQLIDCSYKIIEDAYKSLDAKESLNKAEALIYSISKDVNKNDLEHISEPMTKLMERIDIMAKNKGALRGLMTSYPLLDRKTNGLQKGDLIILAARPSVGKTSYALNIVANIARNTKQKKSIAIFSLEMPAIHLAQRISCNLSDVSMNDIGTGDIKSAGNENLWKTYKLLSGSSIYIDDSSLISPGEILSKCRRLASRVGGLDLIVVDYLQLMQGDNIRSNSRLEDISNISRMLKITAKELGCPLIALSQMSRGIEGRTDKNPKLSDLRESGSIEQDADIVMFLSRENEDTKVATQLPIILELAKHRNGELGKIRYIWEGPYIRFRESENQNFQQKSNNVIENE